MIVRSLIPRSASASRQSVGHACGGPKLCTRTDAPSGMSARLRARWRRSAWSAWLVGFPRPGAAAQAALRGRAPVRCPRAPASRSRRRGRPAEPLRGRPCPARVHQPGAHHVPEQHDAGQRDHGRQQVEVHVAHALDQAACRGAGDDAPDDARCGRDQRVLRRGVPQVAQRREIRDHHHAAVAARDVLEADGARPAPVAVAGLASTAKLRLETPISTSAEQHRALQAELARRACRR